MALKPEQQKKLNDLLRDGLLTTQQHARAMAETLDYAKALDMALGNTRDTTADLYSISQGYNDELRKALGVQIKRSKEDSDILKTNNDITNQLGKQIKNYGSIGELRKDQTKNSNLAKKAGEQVERLLGTQVDKINQIVDRNNSLAELQNQLLLADDKKAESLKQEIYDLEQANKKAIEGLSPREQAGLLGALQVDSLNKQNDLLQGEIEKRNDINKRLGITGGLLKGAQKIASKFGLEGLEEQFNSLNKDLEKLASEGGSKAQVMGAAFGGIGKIFGEGLKDPLAQLKISGAIISKIFGFFTEILKLADSTMNSIVKNTGLQGDASEKVYRDIQAQGEATDNVLMNTVSLTESFTKLTEQTGILADFGGQTLETFTALTKQLGMGEEQATKLTMMARMQGKETEKVLSETVEVVNTINKQNKTALSAKEILKDVANVSTDLAVTLGQSPQKIAEAAAEAKLLGLSLDEVAGVADGLLNIENSLQKEMEAEIILGKELNLEKARSLALDNDMAGLAEELRNQEEIMLAFRTGNRVQQQAAAEALGMSREQLAQMIQMEDYRKMSQEEFTAAYGEQSYKQMEQLSAQEELNAAMMEFKVAMADIAVKMIPIIQGFAKMVAKLAQSKGLLVGIAVVMGLLAALSIANMVANIIAMFSAVIPVIGPVVGAAVAGAMVGALGAMVVMGVAKAKSAKDYRQKAGRKAVMSQTLGGLEPVVPALEDDVVMGPGILDKVESAEKMAAGSKRNITTSVIEAKAQSRETVVVNNDNSELINQNRQMMNMFSTMNSTLGKINEKDTNVYLGSEQVQKNLNRSTAGMR